jgi:hypothetical protein
MHRSQAAERFAQALDLEESPCTASTFAMLAISTLSIASPELSTTDGSSSRR